MKHTLIVGVLLVNSAFALSVVTKTTQAHVLLPLSRGVVSTQWLHDHLNWHGLVVVDVRSPEAYATGHIPTAVNIPFASPESAWVTVKSGLLLELPDKTGLFHTLGAAGITPLSSVVVVGAASAPGVPASYPLAQTARVADTLIYAGVLSATILDGGFDKWHGEQRPETVEQTVPTPFSYSGWTWDGMFVSKDHVAAHIGDENVLLLDVRDAGVYAGDVVEPFAPRPGHIPSAKSLPAPLIWNADGTYKSAAELRSLLAPIWAGEPWQEIVVYCGVGGYASGWWFALTQMLGYFNVRFYDGSAQEWAADPNAPLETN